MLTMIDLIQNIFAARIVDDKHKMFLADLHVHSNFSDGHLSVAELVDFYGQRGFGAIAVTDHICEQNTFLGMAARYLEKTLTPKTFALYQQELERQGQRALSEYGMVLIPGLELTKNSFLHHRSAHVLGLGIRDFIGAESAPVELARQIRAQGGVAIAAHPVPTREFEAQTYFLWNRREEYRHEFDAWEVASGKHYFDEVQEAGLPLIASSDLHHPSQIESWKTQFDCERSEKAILQAIRAQELETVYFSGESDRR